MADSKTLISTVTSAENTEVTIKRYEDGAISLSSDHAEHFIYLYPAQVEVLRAILRAEL